MYFLEGIIFHNEVIHHLRASKPNNLTWEKDNPWVHLIHAITFVHLGLVQLGGRDSLDSSTEDVLSWISWRVSQTFLGLSRWLIWFKYTTFKALNKISQDWALRWTSYSFPWDGVFSSWTWYPRETMLQQIKSIKSN
jgi:hypothetical protein